MPAKRSQGVSDIGTLEKLLDLGQSLIVVRDLKPLLRRIARAAGSVLRADVIVLYEYQEETNDVCVPPVTWGHIRYPEVVRERGRVRPHRDSAVFKLLQRSKPFYAPDARKDWARVIKPWSRKKGQSGNFVYREEIASSAAVPLTAGEKKVGVLFVNYRTPHVFHDDERRVIGLLATQAAIAINNADLFAREQRRAADMGLLRKVNATISRALDIKKSLVFIAKGAVQLKETNATSVIHLFDEAGKQVSYSLEFPEGFGLKGTRFSEKKGLTWKVFTTGQIVEVADATRSPQVSQAILKSKIKSIIGVPLKSKGRVIGALFVNSFQPHGFTDDDQVILTLLAEQAVIVIQNARLFEDARRRIRDLGIVNSIARTMNTKLNAQEAAQAIVSEIARELQCTHCTLFLAQKEEGQLWLIPFVTAGLYSEQILTRRFKPGEGLAGWVFKTGVSLVLEDAASDARFAAARSRREQPRSLLVVPVQVGDQTIGVISADQDELSWFNGKDRRLVEAMAHQAGIAIQRSTGLELLHGIGNQIIGTPDETQVLQQIVSGAIKLTHTTLGAIYLLSEDAESVAKQYHYPPDVQLPTPRLEHKRGLTRQMIARPQIIAIPDTGRNKRVNPALLELGIRSLIGIPLTLGQKVIGVLYLNDSEHHVFTEIERSLLSTLADQAALAINNARLFGKLNRREKMLDQLLQTGREMSHLALQELGGVLRQIARSVCEKVGADCAVIYPYDPNRKDYYDIANTASFGLWYPLVLADKPRGKGTAVRVRRAGKIEISDIFQMDPKWNRPLMQREGIQAYLGISLRSGREEIGALYVSFRRPHKFSRDERKTIRQHAEEAVKAIIEGRQTAGVQLSTLLRQIAENARALLGADIVTLYQYRRGRDEEFVTPPAIAGELRDLASMGRQVFDDDVPALLVREGKSVYAEDVTRDALISTVSPTVNGRDGQPSRLRFIAREGIRSSAGVLLQAEDETVGVMFVNYRTPRSFTEQVRQEMGLFANQAAAAIWSARTFEETRALQEIGQTIAAATLEPERMLDLILEQALNLVGFSKGWISVIDDRTGVLEMKAAQGLQKSEWRSLQKSECVSWHVVETGEPMNVPDVTKEGRYEKLFQDTQSELCVPLKYKDKVLGVLNLESARLAAFTPRAQKLVTALASEAAIAIQNARFYAAERLKTEQLERLNRVAGTLTRVVGEEHGLDEVLGEILTAIDTVLGEETTSCIGLYDQQSASFSKRVASGPLKDHLSQYPPRPDGTGNYVVQTQKPLFVDDLSRNQDGIPAMRTETAEHGVKSFAVLPLVIQENVVGTLYVNFLKQFRFSPETKNLLDLLSYQAAIAIENARLYSHLEGMVKERTQQLEDRTEQLKSLQELGVKITSHLELRDVLGAVVRSANELLHADFSTLFPYDPERDGFDAGIRRGKVEVEPAIPSDTGLASRIAHSKQAIFAEDAERKGIKPILIEDKKSRAFAGIPLIIGGKTVGVLYVNFFEPHSFSTQQKEILGLLANQAAVAIENARLYKNLRIAYDELRRARERETLAMLGEVATGLVHKMSNTIGPIPSLVERIKNAVGPMDTATQTKLCRIREGAQDALSYTASMDKILQLGKVSKELADIKLLLDDALRQAIPEPATQNIVLDLHYAPDLPKLYVNSPLMIEAFRNIISNAVEAMPSGGVLRASIVPVDDGVQIQIADTGCGMPEEKKNRVFQVGFSTKKEGKGIGLWFTKKVILDQHQGSISFESQEGVGTTFTIILPTGYPSPVEEIAGSEVS